MIKENQRALNQINGLTDALILFPCMAFAYFIRFDLFHGIPGHVGLSYYMTTVLCMAPLFWLMYGLMGLYDSFRSKNFLREFSLLLRSNVILFGVLLAFLFVCKQFHLSRWTLFIFFLLATVSVAVKRWMLRRVLRRFREHGYNLKHVLLVGCGEQGVGLRFEILNGEFLIHVAFLRDPVGLCIFRWRQQGDRAPRRCAFGILPE